MKSNTKVKLTLIIAIVALLIPLGALAGPADGMVVGATKIVDSGSAAQRYNLVLIAEGYSGTEQAQFASDATDFANFLATTPPFDTNMGAINVWRIDVISDESGADDPVTCGGTGDTVATYFDATFCGDGVIRRLLVANGATAIDVLNAQVPEWDQGLLVVNSSTYGGSGGTVGVTSVSGTWENIAIHEFGHSAFGLADEYEYWAGCGVDTDRDVHPAVEPVEPNVTIETDPTQIKWKGLILGSTPVPTTENADCSLCDGQANPYPGMMVVGLYEGAHYYHCSSYRPVFSCMMRNFASFCPVCTQKILDTLEPYQPENEPPVCDAGGPYWAECDGAETAVILDGSNSSDPDDDPLTYSWMGEFVEGSAEGPQPLVRFAGLGSFDVELEVNDGTESSFCEAEVTVADTIPPTIVCPPDVTVECDQPTDPANTGAATSADICDPSPTIVSDDSILPGACAQEFTIERTWTATDASGITNSCVQTIEVVDTMPPDLSVELTPDVIWPPNHKMWTIMATITVDDNCDGAPAVTLVSITSNEPDNGQGDGNTTGDIHEAAVGTDDREFQLRAERRGGGDGRIYTATYVAEDGCGNATEATAEVRVPHDQSGSAFAWSGFTADGTALDPHASTWELLIPSSEEFDAVSIDPARAYVGNYTGVQTPIHFEVLDVVPDGAFDLLLIYDTEQTLALQALSNKALGLHYQAADGTDYAVQDVFELGLPLEPEPIGGSPVVPEATTVDGKTGSTNQNFALGPQ